jgi:hypothetical protein
MPPLDNLPEPKTTLEVAGLIVGFARSLSDNQDLLKTAFAIARDAIHSDHQANWTPVR